jgi:hypothetical protein
MPRLEVLDHAEIYRNPHPNTTSEYICRDRRENGRVLRRLEIAGRSRRVDDPAHRRVLSQQRRSHHCRWPLAGPRLGHRHPQGAPLRAPNHFRRTLRLFQSDRSPSAGSARTVSSAHRQRQAHYPATRATATAIWLSPCAAKSRPPKTATALCIRPRSMVRQRIRLQHPDGADPPAYRPARTPLATRLASAPLLRAAPRYRGN